MINDAAQDRIERGQALITAQAFSVLLGGAYDRLEIAGSVRRGNAFVKDIELVVLARHLAAFWARLDALVLNGTTRKAEYSYGSAAKTTTRWGQKYRGLVFEGARIEVFAATPDNWGYIFWLRTGPGDANTFMMTRLKQTSLSVEDGQWYHAGQPLRIAEEERLFELWGMPLVPPAERSEETYRRLFRPGRVMSFPAAQARGWVMTPQATESQLSMFK